MIGKLNGSNLILKDFNNYLVFENPDNPNIITSKCIKVDFKERKKNESILAYDANESGQFTHQILRHKTAQNGQAKTLHQTKILFFQKMNKNAI